MEDLKNRINQFLDCDSQDGYGYGDGSGSGYVDGSGSGYGDGYGYGDGGGIKQFNKNDVFTIDGINTIITNAHANYAKGYILQSGFTLTPCYIVKQNNLFAHGETLKAARDALLEKMYDGEPTKDRIKRFVDSHEYLAEYDNTDFFAWHHVLTGSCKAGRDAFVKDHGIDMTGKTTTKDFLELTADSYGGDIIRAIIKAYTEA